MEIGLKLDSIILLVNKATQGLIATSFIGIVVGLVLLLFTTASALGLNDSAKGIVKVLNVLVGISEASMFLLRFYRLMSSGDKLWRKVKRSRRAFENTIVVSNCFVTRNNLRQKSYVLQRRLDVYQYLPPVSPYAVFGLCSRTFFATLATVISYVVILIKLRGADDRNELITKLAINETITL